MEQIYTVKVRCEPPRSLQYPSERAYSSSTVGGLAVVHLILTLFGGILLLPALTASGELGVACCLLLSGGLSASLTGALAGKLWYVGRHVRWFLVASSLSVVTAAVATFLIAVFVLKPAWEPLVSSSPAPVVTASVPLKRDVFFHVFLSAFLEFLLSLQSVRIAAEGVRNTRELLKSSSPPQTLDGREEKPGEHQPNYYADVVRELCRLQKNALLADGGEAGKNIVTSLYATGDHRLPRPETHKEYKERMENFLSYNEPPNISKD